MKISKHIFDTSDSKYVRIIILLTKVKIKLHHLKIRRYDSANIK